MVYIVHSCLVSQLRSSHTMSILLVTCLSALVSPALSRCLGSIMVRNYGEVFIVAPDWAAGAVTILDNGFTLSGNGKIYFTSRCEDGWTGDMFAQVWYAVRSPLTPFLSSIDPSH